MFYSWSLFPQQVINDLPLNSQSSSGVLAHNNILNKGPRIMLTFNIDKKDHILEYHFVYVHSQVIKVFIKFDKILVGSDVMSKDIYIKFHK